MGKRKKRASAHGLVRFLGFKSKSSLQKNNPYNLLPERKRVRAPSTNYTNVHEFESKVNGAEKLILRVNRDSFKIFRVN